jgi:hypothetical protein
MRKELLQWVRDQKAGGNARPVVAWTGVVPNLARLWMEELQLLRVDKLSISGIGDYMRVARATVKDLDFLSAEDVIHPSAHLMDAGLSRAFTRTSFCLIHTLRMKPSAATCNILDELKAEELQRMQTAQHAYDALGFPHCKGWLQPDLRRLRGTPWQEPAVLNAFRRVKEAVGVPYFLKLLTTTNAHVRLSQVDVCTAAADTILDWHSRLGPAGFTTFMCNSVAAHLHDDGFVRRMETWIGKLGKKGFITFMCGGVAARLHDDGFVERMESWFSKLGKERFSQVISVGGIAARLQVLDAFCDYLRTTQTRWTQSMLVELCRRIPLKSTEPVCASVWMGVAAKYAR